MNTILIGYFFLCLVVMVTYKYRKTIVQLIGEILQQIYDEQIFPLAAPLLFRLFFGSFADQSDLKWLQLKNQVLPKVDEVGSELRGVFNEVEKLNLSVGRSDLSYSEAKKKLRAMDVKVKKAKAKFYFYLRVAEQMEFKPPRIPVNYMDFVKNFA